MNFAMSIILSRTGVPHARLHRCGRICRNDEQPGPARTAADNISAVEDFFGRSCPSEPMPFVRYSNRYPPVTGGVMPYALLACVIVVEAGNLDAALAIAQELQDTRASGAIEVRPILEALFHGA
jgi:hypothetical protein